MKKKLALVFVSLSLVLGLVSPMKFASGQEEVETGDITKMGLGVTVSLDKSKAEDQDLLAQSDTTVAGVAFDAEGKIVKVILDVAQNKVPVVDGALQAPEEFKTKKELGTDYNMKAASGIGKEWDEQALFLEEYFVGMTVEELEGIPVDEDSYPTDEDVITGATIKIDKYQEAIIRAWENAQEVEGVDSIGLGIASNLGNQSSDADEESGAKVQFEDNIALVGLDEEGVVVASQTDVAQNTISFTLEGELDGEYAEGSTKKMLGAEYGMKATSESVGIGKEWDEQAQAYDEYLVGKSAEEVSGIELDEDNKPIDPALLSGATISIGGIKAATEKALSNLK